MCSQLAFVSADTCWQMTEELVEVVEFLREAQGAAPAESHRAETQNLVNGFKAVVTRLEEWCEPPECEQERSKVVNCVFVAAHIVRLWEQAKALMQCVLVYPVQKRNSQQSDPREKKKKKKNKKNK